MLIFFRVVSIALAMEAHSQLPPPSHLQVPQASEDERAVLAAINEVFDALEAGDAARARLRLRPTGTITSMIERPDGTRRLMSGDWDNYLEGVTPTAPKIEEKLFNPVVFIDGSIAMVWGRYTTSLGGQLRHCGFDHFDLVRDDGVWKIQNLTWTVRFYGCETWGDGPGA